MLQFYQDSWLKLVDAIASLIDQDSGFVFDALDGKLGKENINGIETSGHDINYREEPVAFFFVLYGIAFEALITRPGMDSQDSEDQTLEILQALKKILRPSVAGNAIYQDVAFSETMELFDRLALTEGLDVQTVIVEITRNLCLSHPSVDEEDASEDYLSDNIEQLFELTRIIVLVLTGLVPTLGEKPSAIRQQLSDEAATLIVTSLEALVDVADVFPSVIKTDLHACIFHMLTTILSTGACHVSVVPQTLPIFKRFIHGITQGMDGSPAANDQITGCLERLRTILMTAQRRETEASLQCAKNTLLASTILLTTGSNCLWPEEPMITKLLEDLLDCLQDVGLAAVAANCMRSLMLFDSKFDTGQFIASYLLPRLLHFFTDDSRPDPENVRALIAHTLSSYASSMREEEKAMAALSVVIPAFLHRAFVRGKDVYQETALRLLSLANNNQSTFRAVLLRMSPGQRSLMEEVIREGSAAKRDAGRQEGQGEPSIALKFTFG